METEYEMRLRAVKQGATRNWADSLIDAAVLAIRYIYRLLFAAGTIGSFVFIFYRLNISMDWAAISDIATSFGVLFGVNSAVVYARRRT